MSGLRIVMTKFGAIGSMSFAVQGQSNFDMTHLFIQHQGP